VSNHLFTIAITVVVAFVAGRLCAWPTITRLRARLASAYVALRHDPLTGLLNRTGLTETYAERQPTSSQLTLVLVDLDRFKTVNDTYGHDVGDQLLVAIARRIHDAAGMHGGITARLAGDEFVGVLPNRDDIDRTIEWILTLTAEPVTADMRDDQPMLTLTVTASVGVCHAEASDELDIVMRRADIALHHAKLADGNRHVIYRPGMALPTPRPRRGARLRDRHDGQVQP
jgi:diguanylate cyclase